MFGKKKKQTSAATETAASEEKDEALFKAIEAQKKKKRRKRIRTAVLVIVLLTAAAVWGTMRLRRKVAVQFAASAGDVKSAQAELGSVSTTISGYGYLANVDEEDVTFPYGITIDEVTVSASDKVKKGDVLAKVNIPSVMSALSSLQDDIASLDEKLDEASAETLKTYISAGVSGRLKKIYASKGDKVVECMYDNGALALLSVDGYMAVDIACDGLSEGESVTVIREDGSKELTGTVESSVSGITTVLVTDDGPRMDETVTVMSSGGELLGRGELYIRSPLKVTGIAGTVSNVILEENAKVYNGTVLFFLTDTAYSAEAASLIEERRELEESMQALMKIYTEGSIAAPYDGTVVSVSYDTDTDYSSDYADFDEMTLLTLSPDRQMSVTLSVDESNILSLELGQEAEITVSSIGDDTYHGEVTEIDKTATSSSGVTRYSAVITLDKTPEMLAGMTASAVVRVSGVDNTVIIPLDALHQTSSRAFVYTEFDEELQQYGGIREVTAGISNSSYVEIISGLEAGETVWYTESPSDFGFGNFPGDFGNGMPGGGNRPGSEGMQGGNRPGAGNRPGGAGMPGQMR